MARIIVIDDEAPVRTAMERALGAAGHTVILAADGKEGVKQHKREPADLIITDLFMPDQEGLETIQQLRKEFPSVSIIAMSGKPVAKEMLRVAKELGVNDILLKPFSAQELLGTVDRALAAEEDPERA